MGVALRSLITDETLRKKLAKSGLRTFDEKLGGEPVDAQIEGADNPVNPVGLPSGDNQGFCEICVTIPLTCVLYRQTHRGTFIITD